MIDRIKDYFSFSKQEQRGLIILLGLMLLSLSVNIFLPKLMPEKKFDVAPFQQEVAKFMASVNKLDSTEEINPQKFPNKNRKEEAPVLTLFISSPFYFDPNELTGQQWTDMGMKPNVIRNIIRYREKGGSFRDKEGFRKIYGLDDSVYSILEPYIRFAEAETKNPKTNLDTNQNKYKPYPEKKFKEYKPDTVMIDLNSADSASLLSLDGIGPYYAGKIIKYRERLGGYIRTEQLLEIKGMDSTRFEQFRNRIRVEPVQLRKMDLNQTTFKEMLKHPYFEYNLVKAIFSYKDKIKAYDSVGQLRKMPVMYDELYDKIEPYLEVRK
jgi:competence ComEA-like helix-hairpin-helix protein